VYLGGWSNVVQGNLIGVDSGGNRRPNFNGVNVSYATHALLGGTTTNARNYISGNNFIGVYCAPESVDSLIQGNYIGIAPDGVTAASNAVDGIRVDGSTNITIGGKTSGAGNVIGGNRQFQINLEPNSRNAVISGNLIGLAADGVTLRSGSLGYAGIAVTGNGHFIGGETAAERNVIAAPDSGYDIELFSSTNTVISGNYMGIAANGVTVFTNATYGIYNEAVRSEQ
jgi:hypothetical protein